MKPFSEGAVDKLDRVADRPTLSRLLRFLVVILTLMTLVASALLWLQYQRGVNERENYLNRSALSGIEAQFASHASVLAAQVQPIIADPRVKEALGAGDRDRLIADWFAVFEAVRREQHTTHMNFISADRVMLARLHDPRRYGDVINRKTMLEAERTSERASGLETGRVGTLVLRVVQPVHGQGRLLGYVELGKEIEHVLRDLETYVGSHFAAVLRKDLLDRTAWEAWALDQGRRPDWDRLPDTVVLYASKDRLFDLFAAAAHRDDEVWPDRSSFGLDDEHDKRIWRGSWESLRDASGVEVGRLLAMTDVTEVRAAGRRVMVQGGASVGVILLLLIGLIGALVRRTEAEIVAHRGTLLEAEARLRAVLENTPAGYFRIDRQGRFQEVNDAWLRMHGYHSRDEVVGKHYSMTLVDQDQKKVQRSVETLLSGGGIPSGEFTRRCKDGSVAHHSFSAAPVLDGGEVVGLEGFLIDTTERKRVENALRESENRVRRKLDALLCPGSEIGHLDLNDIIDDEAVQALMDDFYKLTGIGVGIIGMNGEVLVGTGWQDICTKFHRVHPEASRRCVESDTILSRGVAPGEFKLYKCKNSMWDVATPIMLGDRHIGNLFLGQFLFDDEEIDREQFVRQAREFGFDEQEYLAALDRVPRWSRETVDGVMAFYTRFSRIISDLSWSKIKLTRDLIERKQTEARILQLQKVESLGRMAGAIAHRYNNLLAVVLGNLELAVDAMPKQAGSSREIAEAMHAARRASDLGGMMLAYLGQSIVDRKPTDLSLICRGHLPDIESGMPKNMTLRTELPESGPVVMANADQIRQMLGNLLANAWEAMIDNPGPISLRVGTVFAGEIPSDGRSPIEFEAETAEYAFVEVVDQGCGISEKALDNIFDPFYSTKFTGRGLGLAVVLGAVKVHDGCVTVASEPDRGSEFRVYLPLAAEPPTEDEGAAEDRRQKVRMEGSTVLLVEDESTVRQMGSLLLAHLGMKVIEASDGVEAVEVFKKHQAEIRCVLCDLTMPRMDGRQTIEALRGIAQDLPVILTSGYDRAQTMDGDPIETSHAFLRKPFRISELRTALIRAMADIRPDDS